MTLEQRMERLERAVRRWRALSLAGWLVLAALAAGVAWRTVGPVPEEVRARRIVAVARDGRPVVELKANRTGGGVVVTRVLSRYVSRPSALLGTLQPGRGGLRLYGESQARARLGLAAAGHAELVLTDVHNEGGVYLSAANVHDTGGHIVVSDRRGVGVVRLSADADGRAEVRLSEPSGRGQRLGRP